MKTFDNYLEMAAKPNRKTIKARLERQVKKLSDKKIMELIYDEPLALDERESREDMERLWVSTKMEEMDE